MRGVASSRAVEGATAWDAPTRVIAGVGALAMAGASVRSQGTRALMVTDAGLSASPSADAVLRQLRSLGVRCEVFDGVVSDPELGVVADAVQAAREARAQVVVALGGGSVLDVAKAAALAARCPELLGRDGIEWSGGMGRPRTRPARPALPTVMLPTTLGTGSEVNSVCCVSRAADPGRRLLIDPGLRPSMAILDPRLTRGLPARARAEATMEVLLRLLVPFVSDPIERPVQDAVSLALMSVAVTHGATAVEHGGEGPAGDAARLALARASAGSHVSWANSGRPVGGHVLWYLANPLAPLARVTKMTAMTAVTVAYLEAVAGQTDPSLGCARRLDRVAREALDSDQGAAATVTELLDRWGLAQCLADIGLETVDPAGLTSAAQRLWGSEELLGRVRPETCNAIYQAAQRSWCVC